MANVNGVNTGHIPNSSRQDVRTERADKVEKRAADESRRERAVEDIERLRAAREAVIQELRETENDAASREALKREREALDEKIREQGGSVVDVEA